MFIIEYLSRSTEGARALHTELALGSTAEEAMDQANTHLPKMTAKHGAIGYRILNSEKECVGIGPKGFISPARAT
jgi:hypothetical protein